MAGAKAVAETGNPDNDRPRNGSRLGGMPALKGLRESKSPCRTMGLRDFPYAEPDHFDPS